MFSISFSQDKNDWQTYFEKSGYLETPRYAETMEYFRKLDDYSDVAEMIKFGVSPQGRDLNCLVVSNNKAFKPEDAAVAVPAVHNTDCFFEDNAEGPPQGGPLVGREAKLRGRAKVKDKQGKAYFV